MQAWHVPAFLWGPSRAPKNPKILKVPPYISFPLQAYLGRIVESTMYWVKQIFNLLHVQGKSDFRPTYGLQLRAGDMASGWEVSDVCGHCQRLWLGQTDCGLPTFPGTVERLSSALFQNPPQVRALWSGPKMLDLGSELMYPSSFRIGPMIYWFGISHI